MLVHGSLKKDRQGLKLQELFTEDLKKLLFVLKLQKLMIGFNMEMRMNLGQKINGRDTEKIT